MLQTRFAMLALSLGVLSTHAQADDLIASHPGVMCASADALAHLTLPSGDSRTHTAAPEPQMLTLAASGGCIDIKPGIRVTAQKAFKNTSVVTYRGPDAQIDQTFVVPNIDFVPATGEHTQTAAANAVQASTPGSGSTASAPAQDYRVTQRVPTIDRAGTFLEILEDARITPELHKTLWGSGASADGLPDGVNHAPLLNAQVQLVSAADTVLASRKLDYPLATLEPAPLHGLPSPAWFLTIDATASMGSYSGPATEMLAPAHSGLEPVGYESAQGQAAPLVLARTGKADWKVVPPRSGATDEIEAVFCAPADGGNFVTTYRTYSLVDGKWQAASRELRGLWESDRQFPARPDFP
ncbi:hypothetical protein P3T40_005983 [Paraburkholderia sp. EB58]|jgi:hypothetical protein|uniref:hypothetical protein n=1 Tax=Paraburkholderia sp. EB58 TaxID=3035125 RepID=UPI003D1CA3EF